MNLPATTRRGHVPGLLLLLAAVAWHAPARAAELSVCIDRASPGAAMDRRLAEGVAHAQHATLAVHAFDGSGGGDDDGFEPEGFRRLAGKDCALVLGFPVDAQGGELPPGLSATAPYGRTGFVLVTPAGSPASGLAALPPGSAVAVTYQTVPNLYFASHPSLHADVRPTDADSIEALARREVRAAVLWRPTVARYLAAHHGAPVSYHELDEPHARWNLVALYAAAQADAAARFEAGVESLRRSGQLARVLAPYATVAADGAVADAGPPRPRHLALARAKGGDAGRRCDAAATPSLYTAAQAASGKQKFADNCALCHGDNLEGRAGPALKGKLFASPTAGFHVGDIFTIVSQNMPATQPGSLAQDDYVEIMAYLLQQNGYPAGGKALTFDGAKNSKVPLIYHGQ